MTDIDRAAWFIHESNLIEGVTAFTRDDIRAQLAARSPDGHSGAFMFFAQLAEERLMLTQIDLLLAHRLILLEELELTGEWKPADGIPDDLRAEIGGWRKRAVSVGTPAPTPWPLVPAVMDGWFGRLREFLGASRDRDAVLDFVADSHHEYEAVHPLIDGNGRTGRLIANYVLAYFRHPIAVCTAADRHASYYMACGSQSTALMRAYVRSKSCRPEVPLDAASVDAWPTAP